MPPTPRTAPVTYRLSFPQPSTHVLHVTMEVPHPGKHLDVAMPAWTPGSYMIREFARHVLDVEASNAKGAPLAVTKQGKDTWRVEPDGPGAITVRYRVYAFEWTVRTSYIHDAYAMLNGASVFMRPMQGGNRTFRVEVELPPGWKKVVCGLQKTPGEGLFFDAPDFDRLVDSPIYCGNPQVRTFAVRGVPHLFLVEGRGNYDLDAWVADARRIAETVCEFWNTVPFDRYVFFNFVGPGLGGGLEHLNSAVMGYDSFSFTPRDKYIHQLGLISHEYFHAWNVKRLRPRELGPFDYQTENYTKCLWIAEGHTAYYDNLLVRRAGLCTDEEYFGLLAKDFGTLMETPGRRVQSLEEASLDAWVKLYRPHENSRNSTVSYYLKGSLVAWWLDLTIRSRSAGRASLDDVMRLAFTRFPLDGDGYTAEDWQRLCEEVAGVLLDDFFASQVRGRSESEPQALLAEVGVKLQAEAPANGGKSGRVAPNCGWILKADGGRLMVDGLRAEEPAHTSGFSAKDEVLAVAGYRVATEEQVNKILAPKDPGDEVDVLVSRDGQVRTLKLRLGAPACSKWKLSFDADAPENARKLGRAWLPERAGAVPGTARNG